MSLSRDDLLKMSNDGLYRITLGKIPGRTFTADYNFDRDETVILAKEILHQRQQVQSTDTKKLYEKPFGLIVLSVLASLLAAYLIYVFGWN